MKFKNLAILTAVGVALAACGGSSDIVELTNVDNVKVYYAFDSAEVSEEARSLLIAQSLYLNNNKNVKVQVAGNADERGTTEYNLALGNRRANSAKKVMVKEGVDSGRISTISYGKERPSVKGTGEEVWSQNRNATTTVK